MKIRFLKLKDWLLMTVMGLMGLTACHSSKDVAQQPVEPEDDKPAVAPRSEAALMYGVPTMDFVLKGRVIDTKGKGVEGMQVILVNGTIDITPDDMHLDNKYVQEYIRESSDTTDAEGYFSCHMKDFPKDSQNVIIRDVDGKKNGAFVDQMVEVNFADGVQSGTRKGWYHGTRTKDVDITVKRVNED
ncbi:MAG: radical SAM-associated putative lipoprotein [Bacteroidales bacterium]|nr:radical SAM-associated putative lipoprotein [Bacteroidales bacterium]